MMSRRTLKAALLAVITAGCGLSFAGTGGDAGTSGASNTGNASAAAPGAAAASSADLSEIVIVANRYEATDLQMKSDNAISVLSAEDLANTAVHNVAEALSLMPGVNVLSTSNGGFIGGIDSASRAEGMFVSIRGMDAEFNVNMVNGVTIAEGVPYSREIQLSLIPPSGLKTVVLNKTSRADMDGDAIGGTADFRTPTAFDYSGPETSITAGARFESRAADYHTNGLGYDVSTDIARRFGAEDQFGLYASAYYDIRSFANSEMGGVMESGCCDNAWAYAVATASGGNPAGMDPQKNLELTGINVGVSSGSTHRFGGNLSLDWHLDDGTNVYFKGTYAYAYTEQDSALTQIIGMGSCDGGCNVITGAGGGLNPFQIGTTGLYRPDIANVSIRYWYETNPEMSDLTTGQLGADKKVGNWTFSPNIFVSTGRDNRPNHVEIDARTATVQGNGISNNGFPYGQSTLFTYGSDTFPYPQLTPAMSAQLNNILGLPAKDRGEVQEAYSGQSKGGAKFDTRYDINSGILQYLKFGAKFSTSSRAISFRDWTIPGYYDGTTFGSLPIWNGFWNPVFPGKYNWPDPKINQGSLFAYYNSLIKPSYLDTCGSLFVNNFNCNTQRATESVSAAYAMLVLGSGPWEVTPGLRFEHTQIHNTFWLTPHDATGTELAGAFNDNRTTYNEPLPSIFVNYRPSDNAVYRGAIWQSYTRPAFAKLGGGESVNPSESGATTITQGNPHLKAITSTNFDLSGEWGTGQGGNFLVGGFYKAIKNYVYDSVNNVQIPSTSSGFIIKQPVNAGSAKAAGLELGAQQKFIWLPAPFDGLGVSGNVTREYTGVHLNVPGMDSTERMENAPDWLANAQIFYEKYGLSVQLLYSYQNAYLSHYDVIGQGSSWDDLWVRQTRRMDLHAGYTFDQGVKIDFSVANLLRNYTYWSHIGRDSLVDSDIVNSGLTAFFNVTYRF